MKLVRKKEIGLPTRRALVLVSALVAVLAYRAAVCLYPFLAQNDPQPNTEMIIIEGWLDDADLEVAAKAVLPGQTIVTTGGPVTFGQKLLQYDNYAETAAARLIAAGIPSGIIVTAPAPDTLRDRTYVSAQAARRKLEELGLFGRPANLYTVGAHSRRSYLLFRHVFGRDYPLGVISIDPPACRLERWYLHSEGFKHVITELISWVYAVFFLMIRHV